jgi:hypothetical protein
MKRVVSIAASALFVVFLILPSGNASFLMANRHSVRLDRSTCLIDRQGIARGYSICADKSLMIAPTGATPDRLHDDGLDRQMILITGTIARSASLLGDRRNDHQSRTRPGSSRSTKTDQAVNEGEVKPRQLSQAVDL